METIQIDGPVGLRWRTQNVQNNARDQAKVIKLLKAIPAAQGGKREAWVVSPTPGPDGSCPRPLADAIWRTYPEARMFNAHPRGKRASVDISIYLNRITDWVSMEELARMRPTSLPQVVVMLQDPGTPPPVPPAGWKVVAKTRRDRDWWHAFVLEPEKTR